MRIVSWNMDQQGHARSHHQAWAFLMKRLEPDIILVQEALDPEANSGYQVLWTQAWDSKLWGSAILSRVGDLSLEWQDSSRGAVVLARCAIPSLGSVSVASVHARVIKGRVIPALRETFDALRSRPRCSVHRGRGPQYGKGSGGRVAGIRTCRVLERRRGLGAQGAPAV
jgi:hypothetical protein